MTIKRPERDLFDAKVKTTKKAPLADRIRPKNLKEFVGQEHLVGSNKILQRLVENKELVSMIFWGPPGVGKTTLSSIIAQSVDTHIVSFSAVLSGVKDIREVIEEAREQLKYYNKKPFSLLMKFTGLTRRCRTPFSWRCAGGFKYFGSGCHACETGSGG